MALCAVFKGAMGFSGLILFNVATHATVDALSVVIGVVGRLNILHFRARGPNEVVTSRGGALLRGIGFILPFVVTHGASLGNVFLMGHGYRRIQGIVDLALGIVHDDFLWHFHGRGL